MGFIQGVSSNYSRTWAETLSKSVLLRPRSAIGFKDAIVEKTRVYARCAVVEQNYLGYFL